MLDLRFPVANLFTASLHNSKPRIVQYLLDNDMVDIATCCRRPLIQVGAMPYTVEGKLGLKNRRIYGIGQLLKRGGEQEPSSPLGNLS